LRKNSTTILVVAIGLVVIALFTILNANQAKRYNWNPTFKQDGTEPYDFNLFNTTLKASYPDSAYQVITNLYADTSFLPAQNGLIVTIDPYFQLDSIEISKLLESAENGNKVFISSIKPARILEYLRPNCFADTGSPIKERRGKNIKPSVRNMQTSPDISYSIKQEKQRFAWTYFDFENCSDASKEIMGSFESIGDSFTNFIKLDYGKGSIYLHSTPLIFTNIHFKNKVVFLHSQDIFSMLPHENVYYVDTEYQSSSSGNAETPRISESPLRFILSNPPLKWAWYLIIALTILYVFNSVRRSQTSIPVFTLPENETANYLDVVSRLYQKEGNHKHIIGIQEKLLKRYLRNKYRLNLDRADANMYNEVAARLQLSPGYLKETFVTLDRAKNNSTLSDEEFKTIIKKIKEFYTKCP